MTCGLTSKPIFIIKTKNDISKKKDVESTIEILLLPLAVTVVALNVGDEGVEGDRVVVVECRSEGELDQSLRQW